MTVLTRELADQLVAEQGTDVVIPDTYTSIGENAFYYNLVYRLTSVVIPDGVTSIGRNAFREQKLERVKIPDSVTSIGDNAFRSNNLTNIVIPDSVTSIGEGAFAYNELPSIDIPGGITSIERSVFGTNQLTNVVIPDNVTSIGMHAFENNKLKSVIFPETITQIGAFAFTGNQLTSVVIPDSVAENGWMFDGGVEIIREGTDNVSSNPNLGEELQSANSVQDIPMNGTNRILKHQLEEAFVSNGASLDLVITGNFEKNKIIGSSSGEIIDGGGASKDILIGGKEADAFMFTNPIGISNGVSYGFGKKQADLIKDFDPDEGDFLLVDKDVFGLGKKIKIKVVTGKKSSKKAATSKKDFIYDDKKGLLYFNENGEEKGWGDGGLFVKLKGAPELAASDFTIV